MSSKPPLWRVYLELLTRPVVVAPPAVTTAVALAGGVTGLLSIPASAVLFGLGMLYFGGMGFSYIFDDDSVEEVINEFRAAAAEETERLNAEKRHDILARSDTRTRNALQDVLQLCGDLDEEIEHSEEWLASLVSELVFNVEDLRDKAFRVADFKIRLQALLERTDLDKLKKEVRSLEAAVKRKGVESLRSALESTRAEVRAVEEMRDHNNRLYAQVNNIKSALRQAHLELVRIKADATLSEVGSKSLKSQTSQLKDRLDLVATASREVMHFQGM